MKRELQTTLLGRTALKNPNLEHCWTLGGCDEGEIVAGWLDEDRVVKIQIMGKDGMSTEMWLCQVIIKQ